MGIVAEHIKKRLEKEIREKGLLIWLDKEDDYTPLVDELISEKGTGSFPYDIIAFRGSFLQLMIDSRELLSGKDIPKCVIHMPGFNEKEIKETPILEAYKAGQRWRASLDTMIREASQGKLTEEQVNFLLSRQSLTLSDAEEFFTQEELIPQEIKKLLQQYGEEKFIIQFLIDPVKINNELCLDPYSCFTYLMGYFDTLVGLDLSWQQDWDSHGNIETENDNTTSHIKPENQVELLISYMMALEFVHDLKGTPRDNRLLQLQDKSKESARKASEILERLREQNPAVYIKWAHHVESNLAEEEYCHNTDELGSLDTFRFEADIFLNEAINLLLEEKWTGAMDLANSRLPGKKRNTISQTFWLQQDKERLWLWEWIEIASRLGSGIDKVYTQIKSCKKDIGHKLIFDYYTESWWEIDHIHRNFCLATEQYKAINSNLHIKAFIEVRAKLFQIYRDCIDQQSELWNEICEESGFLPEEKVQQRFFFKNWLKPTLGKGKKTALFFVDALRYELGLQLVNELKDAQAEIHPMAAELPTITSVGMNALAPVVKDNFLTPVLNNKNQILGFQGGSRQVITSLDRKKTFEENIDQEISWKTLSEFLNLSGRKLKHFTANDLSVITVIEVDKMGESGALNFGLNYFNNMIMRIKNAVYRLKVQGFEEFVITSDHGFLLGDETIKVNRAPKLNFVERRHAYDVPRSSERLISASPLELQYELARDKVFVFDRTTHILNGFTKDFYHGGNTLQERLVPVITCSFTKQLPNSSGIFNMQLQRDSSILGFNRVIVNPKPKGDYLFAIEEIEVHFKADDGITVEIQQASGARKIGNVLTLPVNKKTDILFKLANGNKPRGKVFFEATQPGTVLEGYTLDEYFDVENYTLESADTASKSGIVTAPNNADRQGSLFSNQIPEEFHAALAHLEKHRNLTEAFLVNTLGGDRIASRKARRFNNKIDGWLPLLPFDIVIEQTGEGKVYKVK